jgi:hypothetical protein
MCKPSPLWWLLGLQLLLGGIASGQDAPIQTPALSTKEILTQADEARGNLGGVEWRLDILAETGSSTQEMSLAVKARGFDVVSSTLAPPRSKGDRLIMVKDNMWFHKPGLSKPVPISKRQKLLGTASYGDIATTNYANDYAASLSGEELIDDIPCLVYDLVSLHNKTTYDRIKYWIDKRRLVGIKAEYYTVSGEQFKSARMEYDNLIPWQGNMRPFISKIRIHGELVRSERTTLAFSMPELKPIPDSAFNLDLLTQ